ncbi:MAG TPA: hypothetical protein VNK95_11435, partial [Caldilineaceae bacterium]|nr:hypothetical protein [Caldilineaceae bacterium]
MESLDEMGIEHPTGLDPQAEYRKLPAVDTVLRLPAVALLAAEFGQEQAAATLRRLLDEARRAIAAGKPAPAPEEWPARLAEALAQTATPSLRPLINASGVIIHTNLGRAPLSAAAL